MARPDDLRQHLPSYPDLRDKIAVVTGGSRGIGAATCRLLAANGVKVAVNGRDHAPIDATMNEIRSGGGLAIRAPADVTDFGAIERMRDQVERELGPVDVLAAFVGGQGEPVPFVQMSEAQWRATIDVNLTTTFLTVKSFLPGMLERQRGAIITMASTAGRLRGEASSAYGAAKAGVIMLTRHLANEAGKHGVRVNCLAPSAIRTESSGLSGLSEAQLQQVAAYFPLGRLGTPEDVALAALFLASESSSWLTGVTIDVAGGRIML